MKGSAAGLIYSKWTGKKDKSQKEGNKSFLNGLGFVQNMLAPAIQSFHSKFIYGQKMTVLHKEKLKQVFVYLDNLRDKLLWVSSKTKAFLIDLYFTNAYFRAEPLIQSMSRPNKKLFYFCLKQFEDEVIFVFQREEQKDQYLNIFKIYIQQLRKVSPNYCIYFSNISKLHALHSTQHGSNFITKQQIMDISSKAGLNDQKQNQDVLDTCMKAHKLKDKNQISMQCVNDYFQIQFCSRRVQPIFEQFSKQKIGEVNKDPQAILRKVMSQEQFKTFLRDCQKQDEYRIEKILDNYQGQLSFFDFSLFLYDNRSNSINRSQKPPLDHPLKDYFCYSSHNTYLSGNQLSSDCKAERYSQDLQNGVKCVQLDVHNDGLKPIVTHAFKGTGLCKPVSFLDVIKAVHSYTVKCDLQRKPHWPIILSIQNHASNQNREQMLDIMTRHFGKKIYYLSGNQTQFPQLGDLMGAILIKTNSKQEEVLGFKKKIIAKKLTQPIASDIRNFQIKNSQKIYKNSELQQRYEKFVALKNNLQHQKSQFNTRFSSQEQVFIPISSMAKITVIFKAQMGLHTVNPSSFVCTSLTNSKVQSTNAEQIVKYTIKSWLRTYPIATQINSYNYDPAPMLAVGAQIVALNTQTKDDFAWMMYRYFCGGHSTNLSHRGYVLKPLRLRNIVQYQAQQKRKHTLTIKIIQQNGYPVTAKFRGLEEDNQLNIEPGQETYTFKYYNPDQSFVIFDIGDKYRDCVALRFISMGYRILQGRNKSNFIDSGVRILVHVNLYVQI